MVVGSIILVGGPEDLSKELIEHVEKMTHGRNLFFFGVRKLEPTMGIARMLALLEEAGAPEVSDESFVEILVTKRYFQNLTNQPLKINRTNISVYVEKDGKFEIWGYF